MAPNFTGYLKELRVWNSIHNNYYLMFLNKVHRYHRQSEAYLLDYMRFTTIRADASDVLKHYLPVGRTPALNIDMSVITGTLDQNVGKIA